MPEIINHLYEFGPFQLDPSERLFRRGDERLDLPPRVFDTLVILAQSNGRLLEKSELMDRIWPDAAVEENNLTQAIYQLRKVLKDGENGARYIETVPKRGYRFVATVRGMNRENNGETAQGNGRLAADVQELAFPQSVTEAPPPAVNPLPSDVPIELPAIPAASGPASRRYWAITVLSVALIASASVAMTWRTGIFRRSAAPIRSIAVLPLQNLSSDPDQEYFADGMTDELITDLAQISELRVVSKTSIMQYKGTRKPLPQIGRELGVDAVVEGSVIRSGDRVRITAQLIHAGDDRHLWAQSYEGELQNALSLQSSVAESITSEVRLSLSQTERTRLRAARNYNPQAYDLYLRGRYAFRRRNVAAFHEAMGFFEQAAAIDPNFPLAYTGLSDCYTLLALFGDGYRWVPDATVNARRALALDDSLAEAHTSLAAAYVLDWKWAEAEKEFHRTLELNPNDAQAHQWYGNLYLGPMGRHQEAIAELRRALDLDPLSLVINTDLGYAYFLAGQYNAAFQQYQKVVAVDPNFLPVHYDLMLYYRQRGMHNEEIQELIKDKTLAGDRDFARTATQLSANPQKLHDKLAKTGGTLGNKVEPTALASSAAEAYLDQGKKNQAIASLERSADQREMGMIFLKVNPAWDPLRNDPRFRDVERKVGLPPQ
jgi:TolB-like protein/DNA-binding winged helix-turn-helix (wHTH) protein